MVTKNQLRIQMFNVLQGDVLSPETKAILTGKLSEEELGALVAMFADLYPDLKQQDKFNDCEWLLDVAKKYSQVLSSLNVNFITQGSYIEILDNILQYLNFRRENSDVGCKEIFDVVFEYVHMLRCKCDMAGLSVTAQEHEMLVQILKSREPELNVLVMSLLCYFSFDENHVPLVAEFLEKKRPLVLCYLKVVLSSNKKRNFIF